MMPSASEWLLVLGMVIVTFSVRYLPLALSGRFPMPPWLERALRFVPVAVLTAISVPIMVMPNDQMALSLDNEYLVAGVVAIAIAAWRRQLLLTIVVGLLVFFMWRHFY